MNDLLEVLKYEAELYEALYHAAVRALNNAKFNWNKAKEAVVLEEAGAKLGDTVLSQNKKYVLSKYYGHSNWFYGRAIKKDGTQGAEHLLFADWTKV